VSHPLPPLPEFARLQDLVLGKVSDRTFSVLHPFVPRPNLLYSPTSLRIEDLDFLGDR